MRLEFGLVRIWSEIAGAWQMHSTKLAEEIVNAQKHVRTDAYQMSVGEIVNMYTEGEIAIAPEFQRFFRWDTRRKSKLIESRREEVCSLSKYSSGRIFTIWHGYFRAR